MQQEYDEAVLAVSKVQVFTIYSLLVIHSANISKYPHKPMRPERKLHGASNCSNCIITCSLRLDSVAMTISCIKFVEFVILIKMWKLLFRANLILVYARRKEQNYITIHT